jgi:hypothetical protein
MMPFSDGETNMGAIADIENSDKDLLKSLPVDLRYKIIPVWINGLIQQVTNLPSDTYIERWIYEQYPPLRDDQWRSLALTHTQAVRSLDPKIQSQFPRIVIESSNAMNYAFYKKIDETITSAFFEEFRNSPVKGIGEDLYKRIGANDEGHVGDISITNHWARILKIRDWFKWTDFENIPPGYGTIPGPEK